MDSTESPDAFCNVTLLIDHVSNPTAKYSATAGMEREFILNGLVESLDYGPIGSGPATRGSVFHECGVRVEVRTPSDPETLRKYQASFLEAASETCGSDNKPPNPLVICGGYFTDRNLGRDDLAVGSQTFQPDPITVLLWLQRDAFEDLLAQASSAQSKLRVLAMRLCIVGRGISADKDAMSGYFGVSLNSLDTSEPHGYAIQSFESSETILRIPRRLRITKAHWAKDAPLTLMRVRISDIRAKHHLAQTGPISIVCKGEVVGAHGKPYQGASVECFFTEHEDRFDRGFSGTTNFGSFSLRPADPQDKVPRTSLSVSLLYDPDDPTDMVHRLMSLGFASQVDLLLTLDGSCECAPGGEAATGVVWRYEIHTSQTIATDDPRPALEKGELKKVAKSVQALVALTEEDRAKAELAYGQRLATNDDIAEAVRSIEAAQGRNVLQAVNRYAQAANDRLNAAVLFSVGACIASVAAVIVVFWRT